MDPLLLYCTVYQYFYSNWIFTVDDAETPVASKGEVHVADQSEGGVAAAAMDHPQADVFAISSSYGILYIQHYLSKTNSASNPC